MTDAFDIKPAASLGDGLPCKALMIKFFDDKVFMIEFSGMYTSEC